jgi:hypothetical protein
MPAKSVETVVESGAEIFIPLNKLKESPKNARKVNMKKQDMAEAAEQLLAATGWLPALMRTPRAVQGPIKTSQADAVTEAKDTEAYSVAAE